MPNKLGAHEVMEVHEVLSDTINGINQFQLYRPHVTDPQLAQILDHQLQFMNQEYNQMVNTIREHAPEQGRALATRQPRWRTGASPTYGLDNPAPHSPNTSANRLDDRDVAFGMLGCAKKSATMRMHAAMECADPQIRQMIVQGAISCAEQAYETFQYMNQKKYYQVPTLQQNTTNTMLNQYQPTGGAPATQ